MFGDLDPLEIDGILHNQILGRIGCHADQITYIVPISYAYDGECIYAITREGMKINIMRQNPRVCFEVEQIPDLANWQSVICWGEFEELSNQTERHQALQILNHRQVPTVTSQTTKLSSSWPFMTDDTEKIKGVVFRIRLTKKTGKYEKHENDSIYAWE